MIEHIEQGTPQIRPIKTRPARTTWPKSGAVPYKIVCVDPVPVQTVSKPSEPIRAKLPSAIPYVNKIKNNPVDVLVALTTWKGRIFNENFPINLWSLLHQKTRFRYRVVLTLSEEEFGVNFRLPSGIDKLYQYFDNFEVLYTGRNTKALKNYNPVNRKYPKLPIIVVGDDTIYDDALVETVYGTYLDSDRHTAFGAYLANSSPKYGILSPYRIRIFPPYSMYDLDEYYFEKYFYGHNDLFNGLRLRLNHTKVQKANWDGLWHDSFAQEVRLTEYHRRPETEVIDNFLNSHPHIRSLLQ